MIENAPLPQSAAPSAQSPAMPGTTASWDWPATRAALEPLWPVGLALALLLVGSHVPGLRGKPRDWALYLGMGMVFPVLLFALVRTGSPSCRMWLAAAGGVAIVGLTASSGASYVFAFALAQWAWSAWLHRRATNVSGPSPLPGLLVSLLVTLAAWAAFVPLVWWTPFKELLRDSPFAQITLGLSLLLTCAVLRKTGDDCARPAHFMRRLQGIAALAALLLLALASVRTDGLFGPGAFHHWGVFVSPAQMVRQGGWLLWDVPSQYGFLSILTLAALPIPSVWQALYVLNAAFMFVGAAFLFLLLRALRPGWVGLLFAFAATLAVVFLVPGFALFRLGPQVFPSIGAFRFFWCYALLGVLWWEWRMRDASLPKALLVTGCVCWLLGTLWSAESAVYCAVVWLPGFTLILARRLCGRLFWKWLFLPLWLLPAVLCAISVVYQIGLHHGPDWAAFSDYARAFGQGFGALALEPHGPVWALILVFVAAATIFARLLHWDIRHPALSLIAGAGGMVWATSSYFVARSHPNNADNLAPLLCAALAVLLLVGGRHTMPSFSLIREASTPFFVVMLTAGLGGLLPFVLPALLRGYAPRVERGLPVGGASLDALLRQANVRPGDPLVEYDLNLTPVLHLPGQAAGKQVAMARAWLPLAPFSMTRPLPPRRAAVYLSRFAARRRLSGWLLEPKHSTQSWDDWGRDAVRERPWLDSKLSHGFRPARMFENADYKITWYQYQPQGTPAR